MRDPKWLEFIRSLPCASCMAPAPSEAHHSTAHRRGLSLKASDYDTFPLCRQCHQDFHDSKGKFKSWKKERKKAWQRMLVQLYRPTGDTEPSSPSEKSPGSEPF